MSSASSPSPKSFVRTLAVGALTLVAMRAPNARAAPATWAQSTIVPVTSDDPALGDKNAPVTIVEYSDFQCPFCSRVEPTLSSLRARYGRQLRIVWKDHPLPFHPEATGAATAARVAFLAKGNDAFWKMHDTLFVNQTQLSPANEAMWLADLGVTTGDFERLKGQAATRVQADNDEAATLGQSGTPSFLIDGVSLVGAQPIEKFSALIDDHLAKARELKAAGTTDAHLYEVMVAAYYKTPAPPAAPTIDTTIWNVPIGESPTLGKSDALVTLVTFADFQCPFSKRLDPTLKQLKADYGDSLRLVWKEMPLSSHLRARPAATLAIEALKEKGSAGFWAAHDALFASQSSLEDADLESIARAVGLDVGATMSAVHAGKYQSAIDQDTDLASDLGVTGTPHSFVNGRSVTGAVSYDTLKKLIDEEIDKARTKVASGTRADRIYDETIRGGKGSPLELAIPASAPWRGGKDAKIVIMAFEDFQCPFCQRVEFSASGSDRATAGLGAAIDKYGDQIKVVWRNMPLAFHIHAEPSAELAMEAFHEKGNAGFWTVHDALFASQPHLEDSDLQTIALQAGLDWKKCRAAIDGHTYKDDFDRDARDAASLGISGTPSFLVGVASSDGKLKYGKTVIGAQQFSAFAKAIEAAKTRLTH